MPLLGNIASDVNFFSTWRNTEYSECDGQDDPSPDISLAMDNGRVQRSILIKGEDKAWLQCAKDFIGYAYVETNGTATWIRRVTPHQFPHATWLYCISTPRFEGLASTSRVDHVAVYMMRRASLVYQALTYNVLEDTDVHNTDDETYLGLPDEGYALQNGWANSRYVTKTVKAAPRFYSLARGSMQIVGADVSMPGGEPKMLAEGLPFNEPCFEVTYVWHGVPLLGVPIVLHNVAGGCLNNAAFDGYPAQTLRLDGIDYAFHRDPIGNRVVDVTYKMNWLPRVGHKKGEPNDSAHNLPRGHNWVYTANQTAPGVVSDFVVARVTADGTATGVPPYRIMDYKTLFRPDQP